jgi:G3E family GTPase
LAADSELATLFYVHSVLTVVDAVQGRDILRVHEEARRQLVLADFIALTKADLAGFDETAAVRELIGAANALAPIVDAPHGSIDASAVFARQWLPHLRSDDAGPSSHGPDLMCHTVRRSEPLPWPAFTLAMEALAALRGPDLLRVKAIVNVLGKTRPVVYHRVRHIAHAPTELDRWPDDDRSTRIVFVTKGIQGRHIEAFLDATVALS